MGIWMHVPVTPGVYFTQAQSHTLGILAASSTRFEQNHKAWPWDSELGELAHFFWDDRRNTEGNMQSFAI